MIEPNKYDLNPMADIQDFIRHNFTYNQYRFILTKRYWLYKRFVYMEIEIDLHQKILTVQVKNNRTGELYLPFYDPDLRYANPVYEEVVIKYNQLMNNMVNCDLLLNA